MTKHSEKIDHELNALFGGKLRIYQGARGYRFSIDAILLAGFVLARGAGSVIDLGSGSGVLPVILCRHAKFKKIIGIEIQEELVSLANKNIALHTCANRASIVHADMRSVKKILCAESFDTVITNPPFYPVTTGRINPDKQKAAARHEINGTIEDFLAAAAFLLKQTGKFIAIYRSARFVDLVAGMRKRSLEPKTIQFIHPRNDESSTMVLVEGVKRAGTQVTILPPLCIYDTENRYTQDVLNIFNAL